MNRSQRRAEAARNRNAPGRAEAIRDSLWYLANVAAETATGGTIFCPDGEVIYVSADDARGLYRRGPVKGGDA